MANTNIFLQSIIPQHFLSFLAGRLADATCPKLKNFLISQFVKNYSINMSEYLVKNPLEYASFNDFFIRQLDMQFRPIAADEQAIVSPVDGTIAQIGRIKNNLLLQAKEYYFDLENLLGGDKTLADTFHDGKFATLYLAPHNYHRIHMPINGKLSKTIFVPGKLFSVNRMTSELVPNLFSRNERLVCIFDTDVGKMAVILVGALIVGSIQTVWMQQPIKSSTVQVDTFSNGPMLKKGEELGYFKLGSTVITLFGDHQIDWLISNQSGNLIQVGQQMGTKLSRQ